jgi:hypothetical protein
MARPTKAVVDYQIPKDLLEKYKDDENYHRLNWKWLIRKEACLYTANPKTRNIIFKRDGEFCKNCKTTENLHLDHIVPVSKGGQNILENLQVLCKRCNSSKKDKI